MSRGFGALLILFAVIGAGPAGAIAADVEPSSDEPGWAAARSELLVRANACLERRDALCLLREAKSAASWAGDPAEVERLAGLRARVYAGLGRFDLAREAAESIRSDVRRAGTLGAMAGEAAKLGQRQEASDLLIGAEASLGSGPADFDRVEALAEIGWGYAKLGDEDRAAKAWREAEALWNELGAPPERSGALYELAWSEIDGGAISDALPIAEWLDHQVPEPSSRPYRFSLFVQVDAEGRRHATQVPAGEPLARAYAAVLYARAGAADKAETAIESLAILIPVWKSWRGDDDLLIWLAHAQAVLHRFADAAKIAQSIEGAYDRAFARYLIADEQRQSADMALETLRQVLADADGFTPVEAARIMIGIADALP